MPIKFSYAGLDIDGFGVKTQESVGTYEITLEREIDQIITIPYAGQEKPLPRIRTSKETTKENVNFSLVELDCGLMFMVPRNEKGGVWAPDDPKGVLLTNQYHSLAGMVLDKVRGDSSARNSSGNTRLNKLFWMDSNVGLLGVTNYVCRVGESDVTIKTVSHYDDPNNLRVTFNWNTELPCGNAYSVLEPRVHNDLIRQYIKTRNGRYELQLWVSQSHEPHLNPDGSFARRISVFDHEKKKESVTLFDLENLHLEGVPVNLRSEYTLDELRTVVKNVTADVGKASAQNMKQILSYLPASD